MVTARVTVGSFFDVFACESISPACATIFITRREKQNECDKLGEFVWVGDCDGLRCLRAGLGDFWPRASAPKGRVSPGRALYAGKSLGVSGPRHGQDQGPDVYYVAGSAGAEESDRARDA